MTQNYDNLRNIFRFSDVYGARVRRKSLRSTFFPSFRRRNFHAEKFSEKAWKNLIKFDYANLASKFTKIFLEREKKNFSLDVNAEKFELVKLCASIDSPFLLYLDKQVDSSRSPDAKLSSHKVRWSENKEGKISQHQSYRLVVEAEKKAQTRKFHQTLSLDSPSTLNRLALCLPT